ncbi:MAG: DUF998 domain-containing protein [Solobacterium sp.]|nr:DUF998 domain-containing protein [Solobacterium sp.]
MNRKWINRIGITGLLALASYTAAVLFSPMAYPGYNWMEQAVSDLSAQTAPSKTLWNQLAAIYNICSVVCVTCVSVYVADEKISSKLFRLGIHLFTLMNWVSGVGYTMFPLTDGGKEIASQQESMHVIVTVLVVVLSIASLIILITAGYRKDGIRNIGIWASVALVMMFAGSLGTAIVPAQYFGIAERFSTFAAVGFNAVLGWYLFMGFPKSKASLQTQGER